MGSLTQQWGLQDQVLDNASISFHNQHKKTTMFFKQIYKQRALVNEQPTVFRWQSSPIKSHVFISNKGWSPIRVRVMTGTDTLWHMHKCSSYTFFNFCHKSNQTTDSTCVTWSCCRVACHFTIDFQVNKNSKVK